jgi:hypothetical protein
MSDQYLSDGGAVFVTPYDNIITFINCEFSMNAARDYGGGAYVTSLAQFIGCLFDRNIADSDSTGDSGGGALALAESTFPILNCTFSANSGGPGTTIFCEDAEFTMINTILWDDNGDPEPKIFMANVDETPKAYIDHCDIEGGNGIIRGDGEYEITWATGNISLDPLFVIAGEDYRLSDESPCIDTARSDTLSLLLPNKDLDRHPRIFLGEIDMGCYENQTPFIIDERPESAGFLIFPNPATNQIFIRRIASDDSSYNLIIQDISGAKVFDKELSFRHNNTWSCSLENLRPGMYIVSLISPHYQSSTKLIISR